jgi:hypothetical protein
LVTPPKLLTRFLQNTNIPCPSDVLLKREIVEATGGFEGAIRDPYDDQAFYAKVCLKAPCLSLVAVGTSIGNTLIPAQLLQREQNNSILPNSFT